jgi:hypothetical protein
MASFTAKTEDFRKLASKLQGLSENIPQELAIVARKAGYRGRRLVAKEMVKYIKLPQKRLLKTCYVKADRNGATLTIRGNFRIAMNRFKTARTPDGMTVRVGPGSPTKFHGAFNTTRKRPAATKTGRRRKTAVKAKAIKHVPIKKLNKQVMRRDGSSRLPISAVPAVRPAQVLQETRAIERIWVDIRLMFFKELKRRIRFLTRKKAGTLNWQQRGN